MATSECLKLEVPKPIGPKRSRSPPTGKSKGTARDRYNTRVMNSLAFESDARALQQFVEMAELECGGSRMTDYNYTTLEASGLNVHLGDANLNPRDNVIEPLKEWKPEVEIEMLTPKRYIGLLDSVILRGCFRMWLLCVMAILKQ
jgi:hypothetical protein